tara:strand:+ start:33 stop:209 length:177 start_codon:yes stop_codon:yes gene_type:complete
MRRQGRRREVNQEKDIENPVKDIEKNILKDIEKNILKNIEKNIVNHIKNRINIENESL